MATAGTNRVPAVLAENYQKLADLHGLTVAVGQRERAQRIWRVSPDIKNMRLPVSPGY